MLFLYIITLHQEQVGVIRSNTNKIKRQILIKHNLFYFNTYFEQQREASYDIPQ